jgi:hypothetical protein
MCMVLNCNWKTGLVLYWKQKTPDPAPLFGYRRPRSPRPPIPRPLSKRRTDSPAPTHGGGMHCPGGVQSVAVLGRRVTPGALWFTLYCLRIDQTKTPRAIQHGARGRSWGHGRGADQAGAVSRRGRSWADQAGADPQALTSDRAIRLRSGPSLAVSVP